MQDVNIYIETSIHGPARNDGECLYILECLYKNAPATREGRKKMKRTTENQLALAALAEALKRLNRPCDLRIHVSCQHVLNSMRNGWARQWQKNEWRSAKGAKVKNAELWAEVLDLLDLHLYTFTDEDHPYRKWMQEQLKPSGTRSRPIGQGTYS